MKSLYDSIYRFENGKCIEENSDDEEDNIEIDNKENKKQSIFNIEDHLINSYFSSESQYNQFKELNNNLKRIERNIINKIKKHIQFNSSNSKIKLGSLVNLYLSPYFTIDFLLYDLHNKKDSESICKFLINQLYLRFSSDALFYIHQIFSMINYHSSTENLKRFCLNMCIDKLSFGIKLFWIVQSFNSNEESHSLLGFLNNIEETIIMNRFDKKLGKQDRISLSINTVNTLTTIYSKEGMSDKDKPKKFSTSNNIINEALSKEIKCKYFYFVIHLYERLKTLCEDLKTYDRNKNPSEPDSRLGHLRRNLTQFNNEINEFREEYYTRDINDKNGFVCGLLLPFVQNNSNYIIVNFIENEAFCFSTKARVPVKITVECIDYEDCHSGKFYEYYKKDSNVNREESIKDEYDEIINALRHRINYKDKEIFIPKEKIKNNEAQNLKFFLEKLQNEEETKDKDYLKLEEKNKNQNIKPEYTSITDKAIKKSPFGIKNKFFFEKIKSTSDYKDFPSYKIFHFIAKADDDLRQEQLVLQLIYKMKIIWEEAKIPLKLFPYSIEVTSCNSGLIEFLPNTLSIDGIKKISLDGKLSTFYKDHFDNFDEAQINFTQSLAAYSLLCYILQIKDRHNGNILIDELGHIIHIDFGFVLGISPGNLNFESAPFKFCSEYLEIMGEEHYSYYKTLLLRGLLELKKYKDYIVNIVEISSLSMKLPCFIGVTSPEVVIEKLKERFHMNKSESDLQLLVEELCSKSVDNFWTNRYDSFQYITNGIRY